MSAPATLPVEDATLGTEALPPPPPVVPSSASPPVANAKHVTNAAAFNDEYAQLSALLRRSSAGAVRRVVRDNWEKCLLGTEFHTTFVTNVAVHHASGGILQRALGDFGGRLVQEGTTQIANLLTQKHLDDVFTILLPKMSDRFLDAAVAYWLPSIPAQRLLNHLARAERLGYDADDIEEEADEPEPLIPATMSAPRPPANPPPPPVHQHAQTPTYTQPTQQGLSTLPPPKAAPVPPPRHSQHQVSQNGQAPTDGADTPFTCSSCHKTFIHEAAFRYHHRKAVCKRDLLGPLLSQCPFCYKGFASDGGLSYHLLNNVCGVSGGTPNDLARIERSVVDASKASSSASSPALMTPQSTAQAPRQTPVPVPVLGSRGIPGPVAAMSSSPAGPPPIQSDLLPGFHQHYAPAPATPTPPTPNNQALRAGAHLEPAQRAAMEAEMRRAEDNLKNKIDEAKRSWDPADLERRLSSLRNSHATKQSQIRKKYGIRLRTRRGPSAMIEERLRVGLPADLPAKKPSTPGMADGMTPPPNGSQALNTNGKRPLYSEGGIQPSPSPSHPPVKKLAVSELTGGLGGTSATAAMQDPTAMSSQDNSGYYTSTPMNPSQSRFAGHPSAPGSSQRVQATPQRIQMGVAGRGISREEPVDVESSSDSGSDIEAD
ncbi:hypothetical protein F5X68DRAFT_193552 [Plectosphaerella plurivora]|uniref:C2H2-type domain-containing protein n=1 Tax=Plectosphaerella plurivora TaxID=936078 RepID=A0A9P9A7L5_9PEZI|nr:hypothetical protein F5X68DRAFT_193552 [Plectosphaerella plurivora]